MRYSGGCTELERLLNEALAVMNIDGIAVDAEARVVPVRDRVARTLGRYHGAEIETALLSPSRLSFGFSL